LGYHWAMTESSTATLELHARILANQGLVWDDTTQAWVLHAGLLDEQGLVWDAITRAWVQA
jgi:hypothetical protein